jgi:GntR family transcriptional regulator
VSNEDLQITLDLESLTPAYRQIIDQFRHWFVSGTLPAGSTLPSVRRLAIDLGIHHNTVAEAYRILAEEGWLQVSHGRAARVLERSCAPPASVAERHELKDRFSRRLRGLVAEIRASGLSDEWILGELRAGAEGGN